MDARKLFEHIENNNLAAFRKLVNQGADLTITHANGRTPISWAAGMQRWEFVQVILDNEATDKALFMSALLHAAKVNKIEFINKLIASGANPNGRVTALSGNYCLHWAVHHKNVDAIKRLIEAGARQDVKNKEGQVPFEMAIMSEAWESYDACASFLESTHENAMILTRCFVRFCQKENEEAIKKLLDLVAAKDLSIISAHLYQSLTSNAYKATEIPKIVSLLLALDRAVLETTLRDIPESTDDLSSEHKERRFLRFFLRTYFNFPDQPLPIVKLSEMKTSLGKQVYAVFERRREINAYSSVVKIWLLQLEVEAKGGFFVDRGAFWERGRPDSIRALQTHLSDIKKMQEPSEIFAMLHNVQKTLTSITPSRHRHPATSKFYADKLKQAQNLGFVAPEKLSASLLSMMRVAEGEKETKPEMKQPVETSVKQPEPLYPVLAPPTYQEAITATRSATPATTPLATSRVNDDLVIPGLKTLGVFMQPTPQPSTIPLSTERKEEKVLTQ